MKVKLEHKTIEINKLPLGKYSELLNAIDDIPKTLGKFEGLSSEEFMASLPKLLSVALPDVINIISIATPLEKDEVEQLGLDEVTEIVVAIAEVNNYQKVFNNIKKLTARQTTKTD